jgi:hypothetical protein
VALFKTLVAADPTLPQQLKPLRATWADSARTGLLEAAAVFATRRETLDEVTAGLDEFCGVYWDEAQICS